MAEQNSWVRYRSGEPFREEWRAKQLDLVRAMKVLASGQLLDDHLDGIYGESETEWVMELATMVESLHRLIDEKVPGAVRPDVA